MLPVVYLFLSCCSRAFYVSRWNSLSSFSQVSLVVCWIWLHLKWLIRTLVTMGNIVGKGGVGVTRQQASDNHTTSWPAAMTVLVIHWQTNSNITYLHLFTFVLPRVLDPDPDPHDLAFLDTDPHWYWVGGSGSVYRGQGYWPKLTNKPDFQSFRSLFYFLPTFITFFM